NLPEEAVWVGKVTRVSTPESLRTRLHDFAARTRGSADHDVHSLARRQVVGEREAAKAVAGGVDARVRRKLGPRPQSQHGATHIEERHSRRAVRSDSEAHAGFVETAGTLQVAHAERHKAHLRVHGGPPSDAYKQHASRNMAMAHAEGTIRCSYP